MDWKGFRRDAIRVLAVAILALVAGCSIFQESSTDKQNKAQEAQLKQGVDAVGVPSIINWTEMRLLKRIYELRDDAKLRVWVYNRDYTGKLHCEGISLGYGTPYATMFSNPQKSGFTNYSMPNAEPNGLFPSPAEATWWQMLDPKTGTPVIVYAEDRWNAYPYQLPGIPCPGEPGWAAYEGLPAQ